MFRPGLCLKLLFYFLLRLRLILLWNVLAVLGLYDTLIILVYNNNNNNNHHHHHHQMFLSSSSSISWQLQYLPISLSSVSDVSFNRPRYSAYNDQLSTVCSYSNLIHWLGKMCLELRSRTLAFFPAKMCLSEKKSHNFLGKGSATRKF